MVKIMQTEALLALTLCFGKVFKSLDKLKKSLKNFSYDSENKFKKEKKKNS
jgi:hypothetical protein